MANALRISTISIKLSALLVVMIGMLSASRVVAQEESTVRETFYRAAVVEVIDSLTTEEFGDTWFNQNVLVTMIDGDEAGKEIEVAYSTRAGDSGVRTLQEGDRVVIVKTEGIGEPSYAISDIYRLRAVWWMLGAFFFLAVLFGGKRGLFSFFGLACTLYLIVQFMVPKIIDGANPLMIGFVTAFLIAVLSMYLAHGLRPRIHVALVSTCLSIGLAYGLSTLFVWATRLSGMGSEEAFYLQFSPAGSIDPRGLLLGGMIIGALGVLDDITTAQAAAVEEIHLANTSLSMRELYMRGLSVGKEHISSLINTLVLAYTGASLPLLILFVIYARPLWVTLNSELVVEEIVRTLSGSMTLIMAVPLTTGLAAWWFGKNNKI